MNGVRVLLILGLALAASAQPGRRAWTVASDDSCDISVAPAATLLLPFFEVDVDDPAGEATFFTITNAGAAARAGDKRRLPQDTFEESISGWVYFNLDDGNDDDGRGAHQNWGGRDHAGPWPLLGLFDAAWLGNSCSPAAGVTDYTQEESTTMPGPAEDVNP